jgi:hypothetical protein
MSLHGASGPPAQPFDDRPRLRVSECVCIRARIRAAHRACKALLIESAASAARTREKNLLLKKVAGEQTLAIARIAA